MGMDEEERDLIKQYFDIVTKRVENPTEEWYGSKFDYFYDLDKNRKRKVINILNKIYT